MFYTIRLKKMLVYLGGVLVIILGTFSVCYLKDKMVEVVSSKRLLPIYSVECEDMRVSLTFDCAWRS